MNKENSTTDKVVSCIAGLIIIAIAVLFLCALIKYLFIV